MILRNKPKVRFLSINLLYARVFGIVVLDVMVPQPNVSLLCFLKVLSNEKRGNLKAFDRSPFRLFTLRFSNKSMQAPSCGRPRTAQRTLFLSFESNNCFPITVSCRRLLKKSGKLACHVVNSNIAIGSLPKLQTSHGLLALFEKFYYREPIFTVFSNIGEDIQYRCFNEVYDV
jgi:hypothetical protein